LDDPTKGMTPEGALYHWATERNPWLMGGKTRRFPYGYKVDASLVEVNAVGNITKMPPLVGVPCFGLPLPHLRFVHMWNYQKASRQARPGRCKKCAFQEACAKVVAARVSWDPELNEKATDYVKARRALSNVVLRNGRADANGLRTQEQQDRFLTARRAEERANTHLRAKLEEYHWISVNDRDFVVADHQKAIAGNAAARKARMRKKRAGNVPPEHLNALAEAADRRADLLKRYVEEPEADRQLRKLSPDSLMRDVRVWKAAEQLRWNGVDVTAYAIAKYLGATGSAINRERQWIGRALDRIVRYETEVLTGCTVPLWERFDPERWIKHAWNQTRPAT